MVHNEPVEIVDSFGYVGNDFNCKLLWNAQNIWNEFSEEYTTSHLMHNDFDPFSLVIH